MKQYYNRLAKPFLKWAGGKRQLLPEIMKYIPADIDVYYEPFVGAGAVLFGLQPARAVISDTNEELINCYRVIKEQLPELLEDLSRHINDEAYYYQMRDLDRHAGYYDLTPVQRASRLIFLNKTCYNGLFRVNSQGQFNVPFGRYKAPKFRDEVVLTAVHEYLNRAEVQLLTADFAKAVERAKAGDFVYFDPPYDPVSPTSGFTGYDLGGFNRDEQKRLKDVYDELTARGVKCLLSNSATPFILELYRNYDINIVSANRPINSVPAKRGKVREVLVKNW
ncbi:MAG: DNA adenine methylase [Clostridia bacterium]|jgi:DNA adenine methylase|nr:DNA adenine methylase [Clostridia bacterium]